MESSPAFISIPAALVSFLSNLCLTKIYCIFSLIISVITGIIIQYVYILICLGNIQQFTETRAFKLSSCTRPHVILPLHIKKDVLRNVCLFFVHTMKVYSVQCWLGISMVQNTFLCVPCKKECLEWVNDDTI